MRVKNGRERRAAPRTETDLYGSLSGGSDELRCRVVNLSDVGACALSPAMVGEMTQVRLTLSVANDHGERLTTRIEAVVVRCQRRPDGIYDLGLFFTRIPETDREALRLAIKRGAPIAIDS
jgi:c-di-GMP-binding flagellar brake protein YcgR